MTQQPTAVGIAVSLFMYAQSIHCLNIGTLMPQRVSKDFVYTVMQVPAGSLPRTMEVVLRHEVVEEARAGDKMVFVGNLIVVPDVAAISAAGERTEVRPSKPLQQAC